MSSERLTWEEWRDWLGWLEWLEKRRQWRQWLEDEPGQLCEPCPEAERDE